MKRHLLSLLTIGAIMLAISAPCFAETVSVSMNVSVIVVTPCEEAGAGSPACKAYEKKVSEYQARKGAGRQAPSR